MGRKILLLISLFWTLNITSQEDTLKIDLSTANKIINDLEELDSLRVESSINNLLLTHYKVKIISLETSLDSKDRQITLLKSNYAIIKDTYKEKPIAKILVYLRKLLIGVGLVATGYMIGSL